MEDGGGYGNDDVLGLHGSRTDRAARIGQTKK